MQILDSVVEGALALPDARDQRDVAWAVLSYMATGEVPGRLRATAAAMVTAILPALERSRARAAAGALGGGAGRPTGRQAPKQAGKQTGEQTEKQTAKQTEKQTDEQNAKQTRREEEEEEEEKGKTPPNGGVERRRFSPPSPAEVAAYAAEAGLALDPTRFCDFYASKGWRVGSSPMRDWRAAARNWARRDRGTRGEATGRDAYSGL